MRLKVAFDKEGRPRIVHDDRQEIGIDFIVLIELDRRDAQPFGGHVGRERHPPRGTATQVHPVTATHREAKHFLFVEDRHDEGDIVGMRAALIGIVQRIDIARFHRLDWILSGRRVGAVLHRRQMDRTVRGLCQKAKLGVVDRIRKV